MYPRGILLFIAVLAVFLFFNPQNQIKLVISNLQRGLKSYAKVVIIILTIGVFIALIEPAGIYTVLPLFSGGIMYILGVREVKKLSLIPVFLTVIVYLIFTIVLKVPVPMGIFD
jgi:hypothetical protein